MFNGKPYLAIPIKHHGPADASYSAMQAKVGSADFGNFYVEPLQYTNFQSRELRSFVTGRLLQL